MPRACVHALDAATTRGVTLPPFCGVVAMSFSSKGRPRATHRMGAAAGALLLVLGACQSTPPVVPTAAIAPPSATGFAMTDATDPYIWMEDMDGPRALDWARKQNAHTLGVLEGDPVYARLYQDALTVSTTKDRIPAVRFAADGALRDFWQDRDAVRGVWRETSL